VENFSNCFPNTLRIEKIRLDELLIKRGFAPDNKIATSLILSNSVLIDDRPVTKAGEKFSLDANIRIRERIKEYVSRGAHKLKPVIEKFNINIQNRICIDLGASTGGFTEVLLEKGAAKIYAIDVGYGQLADRLRQNPKVQVKDRFHFKELTWENLNKIYSDLFITTDLSFISINNLFPIYIC